MGFGDKLEDIRDFLEKGLALDIPGVHTDKKRRNVKPPRGQSEAPGKEKKHHRQKDDDPLRIHRFKNVFAKHVEVMADFVAPVVPKTESEHETLKKALSGNFIYDHLDDTSREVLLNALEPVQFKKGDVVMTQGEMGDFMYVIRTGSVKYVVDDKPVGSGKDGDWFGELAIMYDSPRAATVICETDCNFWRVDQATVRKIRASRAMQNKNDARQLVGKLSFLEGLDDETKNLLADALEIKPFHKGEVLAKKGIPCETFYLVKDGTLLGTDIGIGDTTYENIDLKAGDCFGQGVIREGRPWAATCTAITDGFVFQMSREKYLQILGGRNLQELTNQYAQRRLLLAIPVIANADLKPLEVKLMQDQMTVKKYTKGHVFTKKGQVVQSPAIYIIHSGSVAFTSKVMLGIGYGGPDKVLKKGEYFGDDELVPEKGSQKKVIATHTVAATEDTVVGVLTLADMEKIILDTSRLMPKSVRDSEAEKKITLDSLKMYRILGAGTFGQVWLVSQKQENVKRGTKPAPYALKIQYKRDIIGYNQVEGVINEKNIMDQIDHPFVIRLVNSYKDESRIYMLQQLLQGGELYSLIHTADYDGIPEKEAIFYAAGMLEGLSYMHRRQIIHRDLKGENVLMDSDGYCVLIDLGFAKVVKDKTYTCCGTPIFMAPEVLLGEGHNHGADLWSLGALIFDMLYGYTPFYEPGMEQMQLYRAICKAKFEFPSDIETSSDAKDLIQKLLCPDQSVRLGCSNRADLEIREHPWFRSIDFGKLYRKQIEAPWIPDIKDPFDVSQFEDWSELEKKNKKKKRKPLSPREQQQFDKF